jgi:fructose-1,6-bisphosphatase/sedoheptulose 1,7-bisphosphatase-like protein
MKGEYGDKLGSENLDVEVRAMMESQHKNMLRALIGGEHDEAIMSRMGTDVFDGEKGPDTDVTIPPPEVVETTPATVESPEEVPTVVATAEGAESVSAKEQLSRAFGDSVISQKPLDEVVLDFLVDNARKRKRSQK